MNPCGDRRRRRVQQEVTNARVAATMREALYMLGLNPSQHDLVNAVVATSSTGSSALPRMVLPDSPCASACTPMRGFHVYPQASCLFRECSPEVSVVVPSTPAPAPIDLNATPVAWLVIWRREGTRATDASRRPTGRTQPVRRNAIRGDKDYMQNLIFEGDAPAAGHNPDETQSQDERGAFTPSTFNQDEATFMRDQVGMDLNSFPLDHEFLED
ncbi:Eyes absent-like protein 4 [Hordeum vulgare]|nr:Eyes absent-like protein 4 [Hordeum vulgare]